MYKHAGRFLQSVARRTHKPSRRAWGDSPKTGYGARKAKSRLMKRLDKEADQVTVSAKRNYSPQKARPGLVKTATTKDR